MNPVRPDPDALLAQVQAAETEQRRGRLKIFFGASAGVGKTYAMLEAARKRKLEDIDVVVGYVELHGRAETEALLEGLEVLPRLYVSYKGISLHEFDLDAALERHPALILVDEYAHTNAAGCRHEKRWQDIEELLDAGIDVYSSLNVQHLESLNDVVVQITGARMQETIPDAVFDHADNVELIDLSPDDLLERLHAGKVYIPEAAQRAIGSFFRKGNLLALRELALRAVADRVDTAMVAYRTGQGIASPWPTRERLLVAIGADGRAEQLVRSARRVAVSSQAEWIVAYVETPALMRLGVNARDQIVDALRLAESLGAKTVTLTGESIAAELVAYARTKNVTKIIISKPARSGWLSRLLSLIRRTQIVSLLAEVKDLDLLVVSAEEEEAPVRKASSPERRIELHPLSHLSAILIIALTTAFAWLLYPTFELTNLVMVYLLGVTLCAFTLGKGPAVAAAILSVLVFDFLFVPPRFSFAVTDIQYLLTFAIMLGVALLIAELAARGRRQVIVARLREGRVRALYELSRELAQSRELWQIYDTLARHTHNEFEARATVLQADANGTLHDPSGFSKREGLADTLCKVLAPVSNQLHFPDANSEIGVAQWACDRKQAAGLGTHTLPAAKSIYLPILTGGRAAAVLGVQPQGTIDLLIPEQRHLLDSFVSLTGLAAERALLAENSERTKREMETQELRNVMLSSISHDLRTPLTTIIGATSSLIDNADQIDRAMLRSLLKGIAGEAERMYRLIRNLLEMTRLETGKVQLNKTWNAFDELAADVRASLTGQLDDREIRFAIPENLPLVECDAILISQVLCNLLENAAKHTPAGTPIEVTVDVEDKRLSCRVRDHGPGLPQGSEKQVFDKFYQAKPETGRAGLGLGLAICRAIVNAHGGEIHAANSSEGGAEFSFWLPRFPMPAISAAENS